MGIYSALFDEMKQNRVLFVQEETTTDYLKLSISLLGGFGWQ